MSLRYIHLRVRDVKHTDLKRKTPPEVKGGATIAYSVLDDSPDIVYYHIAKCNMKDNFCRKLGRQIAGGRLNAGKSKVLKITPETKNKEIVNALINKYYEEESKFWPDVYHFVY